MSTYRTGNHWGVTIVREGERTPEGHIVGAAQLVAVVVNGDQELAERICTLLNGEKPRGLVADISDEALRQAARKVRAARSGVDPSAAFATINALIAMGWRPAPTPCPACSGPSRETVGMVCQTCGTDYGTRP